MAIGKYCKREVVVAAPGVSVEHAAQLMSEYHVGGLVIADQVGGGRFRPEGIVTDRDIVMELAANSEADFERVSVGDIQMRTLITARECDDVFEVVDKMRRFDIRRMPIVDDHGLLVGIVSADDLMVVLTNYLRDLSLLLGYQNLREESERKEAF